MLATLALTVALQGVEPIVDPAEHHSPSGEWVLRVDPGQRFGYGPASYALLRAGRSAWAGELPFTLSEVAVTDSGHTVGYGMTEREGDFVVAIVDPGGDVLLDDRTPRTASRFPHHPTNPIPLGLIVGAERDRFAVRVADEDVNRAIESWRRYEISAGARLDDLRPAEAMELEDARRCRISTARSLPGTDLHLVHWWRVRWSTHRYPTEGGVFTLIDDGGGIVWRLDLPLDYTVPGDEDADDALEERVRAHGAILDVGPDGRFDLWRVADGERVRLRAVRDAAGTGWRVDPFGREPFAPPAAAPEGGPRAGELELVAMEPVELERARRADPPRSDPGLAAVLADGRVAVQDRGTGALHVWSESGELRFVGRAEAGDADRSNSIGRAVTAPDGSVWVATRHRAPRRRSAWQYLGWSAAGERLGYRDFGGDLAFDPDGEHVWTWGHDTGVTRRDAAGGGSRVPRAATRRPLDPLDRLRLLRPRAGALGARWAAHDERRARLRAAGLLVGGRAEARHRRSRALPVRRAPPPGGPLAPPVLVVRRRPARRCGERRAPRGPCEGRASRDVVGPRALPRR